MRKSNSTSNNSGGIGFVGLLTILFIALKLTKVISWTWLWVLSPIWLSVSFVIFVLLIVVVVATWKKS